MTLWSPRCRTRLSSAKLAETWRRRPLVRRTGIRIALVARDGAVSGLDL